MLKCLPFNILDIIYEQINKTRNDIHLIVPDIMESMV